ncbi:MAG: GFA family protein [Pseudomonadota bacterium]
MDEKRPRGSCACGQVTVETRGEPYRVGVCHCTTCRKAHGAPFNFYAVFPPEAVTVSGDVIVFASSEKVRRYSCSRCGAPIYSTYFREDEFYVHPGSFDEIGAFTPTYELFTKDREPWLPEFPSCVSQYPESRQKWTRHEPE